MVRHGTFTARMEVRDLLGLYKKRFSVNGSTIGSCPINEGSNPLVAYILL